MMSLLAGGDTWPGTIYKGHTFWLDRPGQGDSHFGFDRTFSASIKGRMRTLSGAAWLTKTRSCISLLAVLTQTWDEPPRGWNTAPACVPRHDVGRGAGTNLQVRIGAAPVFNAAPRCSYIESRGKRANALSSRHAAIITALQ